MNQVEQLSFQVAPGNFCPLGLVTQVAPSFHVLEIQVKQCRPNVLDDVAAYIMDRDNFLIWQMRCQAQSAGAGSHALAWPTLFASAR